MKLDKTYIEDKIKKMFTAKHLNKMVSIPKSIFKMKYKAQYKTKNRTKLHKYIHDNSPIYLIVSSYP